MQWQIGRAQKYRRLAKECRQLAQVGTSERLKAMYLELAETYDTLARQQEGLEPIPRAISQRPDPDTKT
jgi:hypothetical protein